MASFKNLVLLLAVSWLIGTTIAFRPLVIKPGKSLASRLNGEEGGGGMVDCWSALIELKSCTNEIVLYFLDGEMYLGIDCCKAIRIITFQCWPTMLTSLGFTAQEADILKGYCGGEASAPPVGSVQGPVKAPLGMA